MKLSYKFLFFNFLTKGFILLFFFIVAPFALEYFAYQATDADLNTKKQQVLQIIQEEGIQKFISEDNFETGFGSYNILKEEYVLIEKIEGEFYLSDSVFNEERILEGKTVPYRVLSYSFQQNNAPYILEIGKSLETIQYIKSLLLKVLSVGLLLFLLISGILDTFFTEKILKPFRWIIKNKLQLVDKPNEFSTDKVKTATQEFVELDQAIHHLMERIQKAFYEERSFISQVSHELKTPISVLQVKVEALFDVNKFSQEHLEKILDMQHTLQKIKKTVNALLLMSKVNNQQFLLTEKVDVQKVISELIDEWNDIALDKGLQLEWQDKGSCILEYSNSSLFEVMVRNAISNAVKYSYPNEKIIIASGFVKQEFYCSILNKGELITEDMLFQVKAGRVFLKDVSTDKSGFGLQIMFKVASYLGFSMEIISSKEEGNEIIFRQIISK